jgi:hypothetical protein
MDPLTCSNADCPELASLRAEVDRFGELEADLCDARRRVSSTRLAFDSSISGTEERGHAWHEHLKARSSEIDAWYAVYRARHPADPGGATPGFRVGDTVQSFHGAEQWFIVQVRQTGYTVIRPGGDAYYETDAYNPQLQGFLLACTECGEHYSDCAPGCRSSRMERLAQGGEAR